MTPEQFAYWLQGFVELHQNAPTEAQWTSIKEHLAEVFVKVTPDVRRHNPDEPSIEEIIKEVQKKLGPSWGERQRAANADRPVRLC